MFSSELYNVYVNGNVRIVRKKNSGHGRLDLPSVTFIESFTLWVATGNTSLIQFSTRPVVNGKFL